MHPPRPPPPVKSESSPPPALPQMPQPHSRQLLPPDIAPAPRCSTPTPETPPSPPDPSTESVSHTEAHSTTRSGAATGRDAKALCFQPPPALPMADNPMPPARKLQRSCKSPPPAAALIEAAKANFAAAAQEEKDWAYLVRRRYGALRSQTRISPNVHVPRPCRPCS